MSQLKTKNLDASAAVLKKFFETLEDEDLSPEIKAKIKAAGKALDHLVKILQEKLEENGTCPIGQSMIHQTVHSC
jgi:hypothetical protein